MILKFTAVIAIMHIKSEFCSALNCADVAEAGSGANISEADLQALATLTPAELQPCLVLLGKDVLPLVHAEILWKVIVKVYGSASEIPETDLKLLGWVISGIPPSDFRNLSLTDVDTVAAFGQYRNLSKDQLVALYETVTNVWSNKDEEDISSYDLMTLKQIICAFNATFIQNIHPDAYRDAATELGTLQDCPQDVIAALAKLAVDEDAFGNPSEWTSNKVASIGCVLAGLLNVQTIPPSAMRGLTPKTVKCLPSTTLQSMTKEQLSMLNSDGGIKPEAYQSAQKIAHNDNEQSNMKGRSTNYDSIRNGATILLVNAKAIYVIFVLLCYLFI